MNPENGSRRTFVVSPLVVLVLANLCLGGCAGAEDEVEPRGFDRRSDPSETAAGRPCRNNAECVGSPAEKQFVGVRCPHETYCLNGSCYVECQSICEVVRSDLSPCGDEGLCADYGQNLFMCTRKPVLCRVPANCPAHKPVGSSDATGITGDWSCEDGACRFPGFQYQTQ